MNGMPLPSVEALVLVAGSAVLGVPAALLARRLGHVLGLVSRPAGIVLTHRKPIAQTGGVAVFGAATGTLALYAAFGPACAGELFPVLVGAALFLAVGVFDDARTFSPRAKLALQAVAAAVAVALGIRHGLSGVAWLDALTSWAWIVFLANALNVTDVCDGLVGGLTLVSLLFWAWFRPADAEISLAFAGAIAGLLLLNLPPASIFLGDGGSHLLGFLLAALTLRGAAGSAAWPYLPQAVLVVAVPLFEVGNLVIVRSLRGHAFWRGSADHFALRLQALGLSRLQTDAIAWSVAGGLCLVAGRLERFDVGAAIFALVLCLAGAVVTLALLHGRSRALPGDIPQEGPVR